ncbi:unnamed protein product [Tilletia laevis]|uniref:Methyltransferase small domain-containing protein n=2 Tax=Tilletia TaxID=13289 RepID=A0A177UE75_9BASI|nr:hypothetical protein CF336_g3922 [Tilletia laevis]KAE8261494.1 hypothetical protein A4X03_0g3204 [Tilletia caries]KAE8196277.1 hypothetical protein CF335_g4895 [Tilletia laevis]CAD6892448.1 unnamed protein product [Tilletia caries]CAD6932292.1 unnamed protein product [Tilletia caries]
MSIPTPSLSHLTSADFRHVYEPAEDTFILLDALEQDQSALRGESPFTSYRQTSTTPTIEGKTSPAKRPRLCVEIGSGSGCVSTFVGKILGSKSAAILSIDINPRAIDCTSRTGKANQVHLEPVLGNMLSSLKSRAASRQDSRQDGGQVEQSAGLIDLLVFNPPYVPTLEEEEALAQQAAGIAGSWAGGQTGTRLVDELIDGRGLEGSVDGIETYLSPGGAFYLVAIRQNDPPALVERLQQRGLDAEIVLQRRAGREHLFVIRAIRPTHLDP